MENICEGFASTIVEVAKGNKTDNDRLSAFFKHLAGCNSCKAELALCRIKMSDKDSAPAPSLVETGPTIELPEAPASDDDPNWVGDLLFDLDLDRLEEEFEDDEESKETL